MTPAEPMRPDVGGVRVASSPADNLPLVSIVIPSYNHSAYLDEAIESVFDQDYPNIELLVIDDGSSDNTLERLRRYKDAFYWETQENMGQANTLNKGWRMAKGTILAYLSPDDALLPNAVSTSVRHLLAHPDVVMTYCDYYLVDENSAIIRRVDAPAFDYREMVVRFVCPPGPGAFFLRSAFKEAGLWDASYTQIPDYDYWLRLGLQGTFLRIPEALALFRVHEASLSFAAADESKSEEYVRVMTGYYGSRNVPAALWEAQNEALSNAYIFAARSHLRSRRYRTGFSRLWRGLRLYPRNASPRTAKIVAHGLLNHVRHRAYRRISNVRRLLLASR